jgi:hypothetical protein
MARTLVTVNENAKRYPVIQPAVNSLDFAFVSTAGGNDDGYEYAATGREVVLLHNTGVGAALTFTLHSVADEFGRKGDITTYSLGAGEFAVLVPPLKGFQQSDGRIYIEVSDPLVHIAVLRLPPVA